jgi:radical SAM protein with 4Fe4S-binding SPASM domain
VSEKARQRPVTGFAKITQAFRAEYYQLAKRILYEHRQVVPCYAGWASCQIAPNGDVWSCCIRAEGVGNLRENNYDLRPIWRGEAMAKLRRSIYQGECQCPLCVVCQYGTSTHHIKVLRPSSHLKLAKLAHFENPVPFKPLINLAFQSQFNVDQANGQGFYPG